jgi:hypothetical protein
MARISSAQTITEATRTFTINTDIPDPADPPTVFTAVVNDSFIQSLTKVEVGLRLVGSPANNGFASDMFVSLNLNLEQTSVLLNPGSANPIPPASL